MKYLVIFALVISLTSIISVQLVNADSSETRPESSPQYVDGKITKLITLKELKEFVFEGQNVDRKQIWTNDSAVFKDFFWMEKENTIVFTLQNSNSTWLLDPDTKKLSKEKSGAVLNTRHPPDQFGNMLVYVNPSEKGPQNVMSVRPITADYSQIIFKGPPNPVLPAISSDGKFIVFGSEPEIYNTNDAPGIYLIELDQILKQKHCKEGFTLVVKSSNNSPACVKPETKIKLIQRGWAISDTVILGPMIDPDLPLDQLENNTITLEDSSKIIHMKKGESFVVKLDSSHDWKIDINNKTVIDSDYSDIRYSGSQGVYKALNSGETKLTGVGDPLCLSSDPSCKSYSILFQLNINVR